MSAAREPGHDESGAVMAEHPAAPPGWGRPPSRTGPGRPPSYVGAAGRGAGSLMRRAWTPAVAGSLRLWLLSRLAVLIAGLAGVRLIGWQQAQQVPGFRAQWDRWDVQLFTKVARYGYLSPAYRDTTQVDFPGMPIALRGVHLVVRDWVTSGLVISFVAGAAACVALWRLAGEHDAGGDRAGRSAVLFLVLFPYAVFLFAGYSEGLFLGFAACAWLAARRGNWAAAGLLGAGATSCRVIGIPFAVALLVEHLVARRRSGRPFVGVSTLWLLVPALPVVGYVTYLRVRTGHWDEYSRAMQQGWGRTNEWPWQGVHDTWQLAFGADQPSTFLWFWRAELLAVLVGVVVAVVLLVQRRWGEATFVGGATLLMTSTSYLASGVRAVLVFFPMYLLLARLAARWRWVEPVYTWTCGPLMVVFAVAFVTGSWVD